VVRAPSPFRDIAAFNRGSFTCVRLARPRAFAPAADPLRLSAGRAYTKPPQALTFSVAPWLDPGSFRPDAARLHVPEGTHPRRPAGQARVHHVPVRAAAMRTNQNAFDRLDLTLRRGRSRLAN
jgi:hypothetical protein